MTERWRERSKRGRSYEEACGLWLVGLAILLLAQSGGGPTRVPDAMVAAPATGFTAIRVLTSTGWALVRPDASIRIDLAAGTISAVLPAQAVERREVFEVTSTNQTFTLGAAPAGVVKVWRNGLVMAPGPDYNLAGQVVTFTVAQGLAVGDIVQVVYGAL